MKSSLICICMLVFLIVCCGEKPLVKKDDKKSVADVIIIDVRSKAEFDEDHMKRAINIPYDQIGQEIEKVTKNKESKIVLHCRSGSRAEKAMNTLKQMGYQNVSNVGGLSDARALYPDSKSKN